MRETVGPRRLAERAAAGEVEEMDTAWRDWVACSVHASMSMAAADEDVWVSGALGWVVG